MKRWLGRAGLATGLGVVLAATTLHAIPQAAATTATTSAATTPAATTPAAATTTTTTLVPPYALGRLEVTCAYTGSNHDDFLLHPLLIGGSHEHDYFGAPGVTALSTPGSITGHGTSCPKRADESAYWAPSLQIDGKTFRPKEGHIYYEKNTTDAVQPFPQGFAMVVGNPRATGDSSDTDHIFFGCTHSTVRSTAVDFGTCNSEAFDIWLEFPNCWDGITGAGPANLVYATGPDAHCPPDHPTLLPTLRFSLWYVLPKGQSLRGARLATGPMGSAHADFVNGWSASAMRKMTTCLNRDKRTC